MIQSIIFEIVFFMKMLFWFRGYNFFYICLHVSVDIIKLFCNFFDFLAESLKANEN